MVVPIMVLLFFKKKSGEIADKPSEKGVFSKDLPIKKEVPYWGEHGTSTDCNTGDYFISSSFIRLTKWSIKWCRYIVRSFLSFMAIYEA